MMAPSKARQLEMLANNQPEITESEFQLQEKYKYYNKLMHMQPDIRKNKLIEHH